MGSYLRAGLALGSGGVEERSAIACAAGRGQQGESRCASRAGGGIGAGDAVADGSRALDAGGAEVLRGRA